MTSVSVIPPRMQALLTCPITQAIMVDPVQVDCEPRHAFDRKAIEQWLQGNKTCPVCRAKVTKVVAERNLKEMLEVYAPPKLSQSNVQVLSFDDSTPHTSITHLSHYTDYDGRSCPGGL